MYVRCPNIQSVYWFNFVDTCFCIKFLKISLYIMYILYFEIINPQMSESLLRVCALCLHTAAWCWVAQVPAWLRFSAAPSEHEVGGSVSLLRTTGAGSQTNSKAREKQSWACLYFISGRLGWDCSILKTGNRCAAIKYCCELLAVPVSGLNARVLFFLV